ncbi:leukotriene B4 receptor 2b [Scleropages formosus]|uniref:Leukotriene B4 receptor 2b n=1 Tax=Scleropages formosus TaxID=113540 RepID=A0A8C9V3X8_SCLFO|nr:leukotriene B4 receptor 1-like [Scleropages formosus]XP_018613604.1 leukotriene B4 receptor 1-like [Scleropages formosus]XP_018613605.1 leukotriene B4 receptor 1-like [Scleropages formosus]
MAKNEVAFNTTSNPLFNFSAASSLTTIFNVTSTSKPDPSANIISNAVGAFILSLVFLLGVPGNTFIIWSILARARKHSVTTFLILNLAFADGCLMALTVFFVVYLAKQSWVFGNAMCKILFYLCNTNMYASIMLITLMSLHRLVAVVWPHRLHAFTGRRTIMRLMLGLWVLVLLMAIPGLLFREEKLDTSNKGNPRKVCDAKHTQSKQVIFHYTFETVMGFVVPYALIVGSYSCIVRRLRQTKFHRQVRSEKLIMAIVVTFGLFWLPYHIINIMQVASELFPQDSAVENRLKSCRVVTSALAFISSCANPVLYTFAGKSYIRQNGLSFMARLFEGTALDYRARKKRRINQTNDGLVLKEKEADSLPSDSVVKNKV